MIEITNLSKRFKQTQALHPLNLSIPGGCIFGLLGQNGAGKTTLLRILATLLAPSTGQARIAGLDVVQDGLAVRRKMGTVSAGMGVYERLSGRENLHFFGQLYGMQRSDVQARVSELMRELAIGDWIDQRAGGYSTGMKQKIVIARAVLHRPDVLLLDEASNGLDVLARRALMDFALSCQAQNRLVIYSTHVMSEAEALCDHAAILHQGRLIASDSLPNLLQQSGANTLEQCFINLVSVNEQIKNVR
jgi:sodium transport system ATP-binding protein